MSATCPPLTIPRPLHHRWPANPRARDKQRMYAQTVADWCGLGPQADLWVFAYARLVWRPEFVAAEQRPATVWGYHHALRIRQVMDVPPALVFALSTKNPQHIGALSVTYRHIFDHACGRYGSTRDHALQTWHDLRAHGIHDHRR